MTTLRRWKPVLSAAELLFAAVSLVAARQADRAMDKSGIGDLERFAFWNSVVGLSVMLFFLFWVAAVLLAVFAWQRGEFASASRYWKNLVPDVFLPPVVLAAGWLAYVIFS